MNPRKTALAWACAATVCLGASEAFAQHRYGVLGLPHRNFESPQNFAVEVRVAHYLPQVDSEPALQGKTPFVDTYGTMRRALVGFEIDWQALRIPYVGTLGVGLSASYTLMTDNARYANSGARSPETSNLEVIPFYGVGVFRVDVLDRALRIPLVPYGKIGVGYALWRSYTEGGLSRVSTGSPERLAGHGGTMGTHFAAGLALDLNMFDPLTARTFDESMGVNHTYLFGEVVNMNLTGINQSNALYLKDTTWAAGLTFEF